MSIRKRLSPEESRKAALAAARLLLIEAGPQAVTLKAVAAPEDCFQLGAVSFQAFVVPSPFQTRSRGAANAEIRMANCCVHWLDSASTTVKLMAR